MTKLKVVSQHNEEETMVDRQKLITWWDQDIVNNCRILVIGAGATGNEVLKNLALIGAGRIAICDMDQISTSNLSRTVLFNKDDVGKYKAEVAAQRVKEMSVCPDIQVDYYIGDIIHGLGDGIFRQFDVVIGCLDNLEARLSATKRCNLLSIPYIDTGINELAMSVQVFHYPHSSCFACGVSSAEIAREYGIRHSCDTKRKKFVEEKKAATIMISTAIAGAFAVQEAMKIVHHMEVEYGRKYYHQGLNNAFECIRIRSKEDCRYHNSYENIQHTSWTNEVTLQEFLTWVSKENGGGSFYIDILGDYKFTKTGLCKQCQTRIISFFQPDYMTYTEDFYCDNCKKLGNLKPGYARSDDICELHMSDASICGLTLAQLGIPHGAVLKVRSETDEEQMLLYELSGDLNAVLKTIQLR